ncbi:helix-turn-helix domain-containing protein [Streptomyces microflavus]|uniref:helix-turn-helix domain-containing protein n=1 Tax=Streptomyces microflavus TaxID=1919 RepID=UPI0032517314
MTTEKRRPRPAAQYGPTAAAVAENVGRLRRARGMTIYGLSGALQEVGRPITPSAVAKIERQQRQVSVDDLAALAVVLGVSPSALLLPLRAEGEVEVTGAGAVPAVDAWEWMDGARPLVLPEGDNGTAMLEYMLWSRPRRAAGVKLDEATRRWAVTLEGRQALADSLEAAGHKVDRNDDGTLRGVHWKQGD